MAEAMVTPQVATVLDRTSGTVAPMMVKMEATECLETSFRTL